MLKIDAAVTAATAAVYESRYPYLLILHSEDGAFTASTWEANTTPAEVRGDSPNVMFWGKVPTLDFYELFTTASEWDTGLFHKECEKHGIAPADGWNDIRLNEFAALAEKLWNALSDADHADYCRTFWDHYDLSGQIREIVEAQALENLRENLEIGETLWRLETGPDGQDALIIAVDWQEAAHDACFAHGMEALPEHWRIRAIE